MHSRRRGFGSLGTPPSFVAHVCRQANRDNWPGTRPVSKARWQSRFHWLKVGRLLLQYMHKILTTPLCTGCLHTSDGFLMATDHNNFSPASQCQHGLAANSELLDRPSGWSTRLASRRSTDIARIISIQVSPLPSAKRSLPLVAFGFAP